MTLRSTSIFHPLILRRVGPALFLLATSGLFGPAAAQEASELPFVEAVDVRVVNVEVYVEDSEGRRVTDLKKEDFEVFEDGRPMPLTNFYAVSGGRIEAEVAPLAPPEIRTTPETTNPAPVAAVPVVPEDQRLSVVAYVDNLHIRPFHRNRVLSNLRQFLRTQVPAGSRVALVTYDRDLHLRESFTTDIDRVVKATFEIEDLSALLVQKGTDRDEVVKHILRTNTDEQSALDSAETYARAAYFDVDQSVRGMTSLVEMLAGLPGRKALVHVSDGIESRPGEDIFQLVQSQFSQSRTRTAIGFTSGRYDARALFRELVSKANANRVTFYTIEAAGLKATSTTSADRAGGTSTLEIDTTYHMNRQETLLFMADETGGLASINTSNFTGTFAKIAEDFNNYYSLGYRPAFGGDGRYHKIEVKLKRKGLKVRFRDGYRSKTLETRTAENALGALMYGLQANDLGIEVVLLDPFTSEGKTLLPVEVRIPIGQITLLPHTGRSVGNVRVAIAVISEDGATSPVEQNLVPIEVPEKDLEIARGKFFVYSANLLMRKGRQKIAVSVRDEVSGSASTVTKVAVIGS
jgi:VWFA-related protein